MNDSINSARRGAHALAASAVVGAALAIASAASASTLVWDSNGTTTPNPRDGAGTWDTTALNWWNGASNVAWNNANNDTAQFGAGGAAGVVTMNVPITAAGIIVSSTSGSYQIGQSANSTTLTLGGASPATVAISNASNVILNAQLANTGGLSFVNTTSGIRIAAITADNTGTLNAVTIGGTNAGVDDGPLRLQIRNSNAFAGATVTVNPGSAIEFASISNINNAAPLTLKGGIGPANNADNSIGQLFFSVNGSQQSGNIILAGDATRIRTNITAAASTPLLSGTISETGGPRSIQYQFHHGGVGLTEFLRVSGTNTYTGNTNINIADLNSGGTGSVGTLFINSDRNFGSDAGPSTISFTGIANDSTANTTGRAVVQLDASVDLHANRSITTTTLDRVSFNTNGFNLSIAGAISGTSTLAKEGSGSLTIAGGSNYAGAVLHNAGTLGVAGAGQASGIGTLGTGSLTLASGTTYVAELDTGALTADRINVTGNLSLAGTLSLADLGGDQTIAGATTLVLFTYTGSLLGTFDGLADDSSYVLGSNTYTLDYNDNVGGLSAVTLSTVPEPTSALVAMGLFLSTLRRRTRA
jgi:autotransporter-associated beta strand protein